MKGTIEATIPNAEKKILNDKKEMAEHVMVVDLLRNDLSMVSKKVRVEKFRYIEKIKAGERELLQVSSKIKGELEPLWQDNLGDILTTMLPAGSITGAPKKSTTEIIKKTEGYERGFFSGVFGVFDGESLDSAVMIRFIEKTDDGLVYKSGGGITIDSICESEYLEMCEKVYVPFF
jgi:para-aminobenzoate synthetase component 1